MKIRHIVGVLVCAAGVAASAATASPAFADPQLPSGPIPPPVTGANLPTSTSVPSAPNAPVASPGDSSASVTVSPQLSNPINNLPTGYTVVASPGLSSCQVAGPAGSCTVTGLTNGTAYTFTATASNDVGSSSSSTPSNSVTPNASPATPLAPLAFAGLNSAWVVVAGPAVTEGSSIPDSYTVTASPGGQTCTITGVVGLCQVVGMYSGSSYTFTVIAHSSGGASSDSSAPSGSVSPIAGVYPDGGV
jgi:hypothetical protein